MFLRLMHQQIGCHIISNTKMNLHHGKYLPEIERCLHKMSLVTRLQLKTHGPLNIMQNSLHNMTLKTFVLNNQTLHAHTVMRTTFRLRVQDRAHFRENNFYQYRQQAMKWILQECKIFFRKLLLIS